MKLNFTIALFLIITNSNFAQDYKLPIGKPYKTRSISNPIIYIDGFKEYFFRTVKIKGYDDYKTEIRFDETYSAFYTQKIMFDNYGKWIDKIKVKGIDRTGLLWKNIDLFKDGNLYNIIAFGLETNEEIFSSLVIIDSNGKDCMKENYPDRQKLINFFITKFYNLSKSELFYTVYWNTFPR